MTTLAAQARNDAREITVPSRQAATIFHELMAFAPEWRAEFISGLDRADFAQVMAVAEKEGGSPYALWRDDPVGFADQVLDEALWDRERDILAALVTHKRVAVPAGFGLGKTHAGGIGVAWFCSVWPPGTALAVTIATRFRQVQRQLWPHVRRVHAKANLAGRCDIAQWRMPNLDGVEVDVAYGFTAPPYDESAMQGIHAPKVLLVVDEAGGISQTIGKSTRNLLTGDATMLAIGNPATEEEGTWFEGLAEDDGADEEKPDTITIRIPATDAPGVNPKTDNPVCRSCPRGVPEHLISVHLVDRPWIEEAIAEHGAEAPYVVAKVDAKFPKGGASRAIPGAYVDAAIEAMALGEWWDPELRVHGLSLDRRETPYEVQPYAGAQIRLGVDVASDGGDELVIARLEGDICRVRHTQSGAGLDNSVVVSGIVLDEILAAERLAEALGSRERVRVKVDAIGLGWGVVSTLEAWGSEQRHNSIIVRVIVSESPDKPDDPKAQWRPRNKRAEMWLNGRDLLKPAPGGRTPMRLDVGTRTAAQLRAPMYGTDTSGRHVIERKVDLKKRLGGDEGGAGKSPDRAEAVLLTAYEPRMKRKGKLIA